MKAESYRRHRLYLRLLTEEIDSRAALVLVELKVQAAVLRDGWFCIACRQPFIFSKAEYFRLVCECPCKLKVTNRGTLRWDGQLDLYWTRAVLEDKPDSVVGGTILRQKRGMVGRSRGRG